MATATGRHLWAGALANASLALVLSLVAFFALRRGERWALLAASIPIAVYAVPVLVIDATHVGPGTLVATLAPQVAGLAISVIGIALAASGLRWPRR